jgi:hypothetical protein
MNADVSQKVTGSHLKRDAYLYVRQSTVRQVFENTESTQRQYGLRQRAVALGWPPDRVVVIDTDLGQSGASAGDRAGFQRLVADVGMGRESFGESLLTWASPTLGRAPVPPHPSPAPPRRDLAGARRGTSLMPPLAVLCATRTQAWSFAIRLPLDGTAVAG